MVVVLIIENLHLFQATLPAHLASDGDVDREAIEAAEISRGEARKRERAEEFKEG